MIVGGARGIGLATVREFLAEGADVHTADICEPAERLPVEQCRHTSLDATDETQVEAFVDGVISAAGRIDVLVNNVGIHLGKPLVDTTPAEFDRLFAVNVRTAFLASDESRFVNGVALAVDGAKAAGAMPANRYRTDFELGPA